MTKSTFASIAPILLSTAANLALCPILAEEISTSYTSCITESINRDNNFLSNRNYFDNTISIEKDYENEKKIKILDDFICKLAQNTVDINPNYTKLVNENFWDLI